VQKDSIRIFTIKTPPYIDSLKTQRLKHVDSLKKAGYLTLKYESLLQHNDTTWLQAIDLGQKIDSITITYIYSDSYSKRDSTGTLSRKRHTTIPISQLDQFIKLTESTLNNSGTYFNAYQFNNISITDDHTATADLEISISKKRTLDNVVIKGYLNFPEKLLRRLIKKRLLLNDKNIKSIERQATSKDIATITKPSEILYKKDSTKIYLYLKKKKNNRAEGMLGLNNANSQDKTEINGYVDLELNNNLDKAETFKLLYRNDGNDITTLDIRAAVPLLIYERIGIKSSLNITRRDSLYSNVSFNAGIFYNLGTQSTIGLNYINYVSTDIREQSISENITSNGVNTEFTYLNPTNETGIINENTEAQASIGIQSRKINNVNNNQFVTDATIRKLWHLSSRIKFFNLLKAGVIASEDLRLNELHQIGGINSIRGFAQNSVDTSSYLTLLNELRWSLNEQIYLYSITDVGVFENFATSEAQNLYGLGAGIAILTQSGIVTFSLANGSFDKANLELSSLIAHVNLRIRF
jgi:tmRNA-binding protein